MVVVVLKDEDIYQRDPRGIRSREERMEVSVTEM